ncbi:MAG TPA: twin-arginine translocase subunit TatC [Solirubrobacteraceae bacterium]|jgi:sec-independent protein translocase protein TatC|nr:twin-arginine translocase subunit TatC [Solirubrobacteraceae bacterium]
MQVPGALAPVKLRPVGHDAHMSVVDHLEELRTRLIVSLLAVAVAFGLCFWQNHQLLRVVNEPLAHNTQAQVRAGHGPLGATYAVQQSTRDVAKQLDTVVALLRTQSGSSAARSALSQVQHSLGRDLTRLSAPPNGNLPVTLGIGEPFTTTITVTLLFALILSLPVLLLQAYGFFMPAFAPAERRRMLPVVASIPLLFAAGVAFGYEVVLPAALHFFQNFNSSEFNVLVQASQYYKFAATTLLAMGLLFQVPVAIIAVTRAGLITPRQLRRNRRWAVLACCGVAAILPGDAITMLLETLPLYFLFEFSVLIATLSERRERRRAGTADRAGPADHDESL